MNDPSEKPAVASLAAVAVAATRWLPLF